MELLPYLIIFFFDFNWLDILDILLVAFLIYQVYKLVKGTAAIKILIGIVSIYLVWKVVGALRMEMLSEILGQFIGVGVIALLIVFQPELRRFLLLIGDADWINTKRRMGLFQFLVRKEKEQRTEVSSIINATRNLSSWQTGALIVIARTSDPSIYIMSGDKINAKLNSKLLETIFIKNTPLHDGAVIVNRNIIKSARCVLPVSKSEDFPKDLGMRHRSALGIAEMTDAIAVVISEETGKIAVAHDGKLKNDLSIKELEKLLKEKLGFFDE
ncbi:MAG: diadenylate cyclase CdaA [Flavobacteriales bacterium]